MYPQYRREPAHDKGFTAEEPSRTGVFRVKETREALKIENIRIVFACKFCNYLKCGNYPEKEAHNLELTEEHKDMQIALSAQDADLWFVEKLVGMGGKCKISPTVNPSIDLRYLNQHLAEIPSVYDADEKFYEFISGKGGVQITLDASGDIIKAEA
jgi:hypothetical protein